MLIDACHVFTGNIYCARMHYRVVPEQYFDQGFKLARLKGVRPLIRRPFAASHD